MSVTAGPPALRIRNLRVDVPSAAHDRAVAWWADALGGTPLAWGERSTRLDGARARVGVHVQRLDDGPGGYHLDVAAVEVDRAVAALVDRGATVVDDTQGRTVLRDPAGLPFCVVGDADEEQLSDDRTALHLRVLLLDVPAHLAAAEVAFWAAAFDVAPHREERYPDYTALVPVPGSTGPTNLYVQAIHDGPARMHVDLHAPDEGRRDEALARMLAAGAVEVGRFERWVTVRSPGGPLACVVPDAAG